MVERPAWTRPAEARPVARSRRSPSTHSGSAASCSTPTTAAARLGSAPSDGSYDDVLAEGCDALGLAQLLGVLTDGPELDAERRRVEVVLIGAGMVLVDTF